jgi:hypothetical protein
MVGGGVMSGVWPSTPPYLLFSGDTSSVHGEVLAANLEWCCFVRGWLFLPFRRGGFVRGCLLHVVCLLHVAGSASWRFFKFLWGCSLLFHVTNGCVVLCFLSLPDLFSFHVANGCVVLLFLSLCGSVSMLLGGEGVVFYFSFNVAGCCRTSGGYWC